jgi:hypothetical protein
LADFTPNSPSTSKASSSRLNLIFTRFETYKAVPLRQLNHYNALVPSPWLVWLLRSKLIPASFAVRSSKLNHDSDKVAFVCLSMSQLSISPLH